MRKLVTAKKTKLASKSKEAAKGEDGQMGKFDITKHEFELDTSMRVSDIDNDPGQEAVEISLTRGEVEYVFCLTAVDVAALAKHFKLTAEDLNNG
jgi:hypothetical protein